jgi:hypothetical protein
MADLAAQVRDQPEVMNRRAVRRSTLLTIVLSLGATACSRDNAASSGPQAAARSTGATAMGSTWADAERMPDIFSGMWMTFSSFVEADAKLNVPFTAQAQRYVDAYQHKRDIPYAQEGCQSPGLPITMRLGGGLKVTYAPGLITIYMQSVGDTRFIRMNEMLGKTSPKYYGNSVGHWEGDTLVVETADFSDDITFQYGVGKPLPPLETIGTASLPPPGAGIPGAPPGTAPPSGLLESLSAAIFGPHGEGMRMVERMRLVDPDTLQIDLEIHDDTVWTKPYASVRTYKRLRKGFQMGPFTGEPEEWLCTVSITNFDPETNTYTDKDPEEVVKMLERKARR